MEKKRGDEGITFLEVMIAVTIFSILITSLYGLFDGGLTMYRTSDAHLEQMQNMRVAMESLGRDLREATSIDFNPSKNELTVYLPGKTEKYGLETDNIYGPSNLKGKKLWKTTASNPLASYLDEFEVVRSGNLVTVTLSAVSPKGRRIALENKFALRN